MRRAIPDDEPASRSACHPAEPVQPRLATRYSGGRTAGDRRQPPVPHRRWHRYSGMGRTAGPPVPGIDQQRLHEDSRNPPLCLADRFFPDPAGDPDQSGNPERRLARAEAGRDARRFPGWGVATPDRAFGKPEELPWKTFTAWLIQDAQASVLPVYFEGQNGALFHFVGRYSLELRLTLLVSEA